MTIKEVEERTGLARANIRFYEEEGLICPLRLSNGYRDYSEEDQKTLLKIKLLRRLRLDLETIRSLQAGSVTLEQAMETQMGLLELDRAAVESARQICRSLRDSGLRYETLMPEPYLRELEQAQAGPHMATLPADEADTVAHPWIRLFARALDGSLYLILWTAAQWYVLRWFPLTQAERLASGVVDWLISILLFFLLEPLLLSTWGTTPGKALFGLKVRRMDGGKLTWSEAVRRLAGVYTKGLFLNIPLVRLYFLWRSYKACREGEPLEWEEGTAYTIKDQVGWRAVAFVGAYAALMLVHYPLAAQAMLPPNRGEVTRAEFIENYNTMAELLDSGSRLDESGQLCNPEQGPDGNGATVVILGGGEREDPKFAYKEEDGVLTGIEVSWETEDHEWTALPSGEAELAWIALVTAQRGVNGFNLTSVLNQMAQFPGEEPYWDGSVQGVRCAMTVENRGYYVVDGMLIPAEDWNINGAPGRDEEVPEELFYSYTAVITLTNGSETERSG